MRVLIVEDNASFARLVAERLLQSGFESDLAGSAEQANRAIGMVDYAAIVLDLGLPDANGITLLRDLRSRGDSTPVLIITARNGLDDRLRGLREGADDYLAKPFSVDELAARLHALMRRPGRLLGHVLTSGNVALDSVNHQVNVGDRVVPMRLRETIVLELLMRHKASVVPRRFFENQLFGIEGEQDSNTVDVYIHRLRKQLEEVGATAKIHTVRGVGYMLLDDKPAHVNI
jgi:two-component system response regulator TctD